jgi:hypothetical protein
LEVTCGTKNKLGSPTTHYSPLSTNFMDRDYEKFRGGANKPTSERIHVTLSRGAFIAMNKNCLRAYRQTAGRVSVLQPGKRQHRDRTGRQSRLAESFPVTQKRESGWTIRASPSAVISGLRFDTNHKICPPTSATAN